MLKRFLYGFKQVFRQWNIEFTGFLKSLSFVQNSHDHCLFGKYVVGTLLIYVDNVILIGNSIDDLNQCKFALHTKFIINDLDPSKYFLGLEVAKSFKATIISQTKFISDVLKNVDMMHCKPASFPLSQGLHLTPDNRDLFLSLMFIKSCLGG